MRAALALLLMSNPRELSAPRRGLVIVLSLAFFFGVLLYAGRKFRRALAGRDTPENRPPGEMP